MMYQGGKARIAKPIAEILRRGAATRDTYIEPFLGSAAVFHQVAPSYRHRVAADAQEDLIMLWRAARDGWTPPEELTLQEYEAQRHAAPSALRAFAGYPCSFGGKWFGGYARDPKSPRNFARTGSRSIVRRAKGLEGSLLFIEDYHAMTALMGPDTVVYCDPPYAGTTAYAGAGKFDSEEFWTVAAIWSAMGAAVLVSEYTAPPVWQEVWSTERHVSTARDNTGARATDRLFALPFAIEALGL